MTRKVIGDDCRCDADELRRHDHQFQRKKKYLLENAAILEVIHDKARQEMGRNPAIFTQPAQLQRAFNQIIATAPIQSNEFRAGMALDADEQRAYDAVTSHRASKATTTALKYLVAALASVEVVIVFYSWLASTSSVVVVVFGVLLALSAMLCGYGFGALLFGWLRRPLIDTSHNVKPVNWAMFIIGLIGVCVTAWLRADGLQDIGQLVFSITFGALIGIVESAHRLYALRYEEAFQRYFKGEEYYAAIAHRTDLEDVVALGVTPFDHTQPTAPGAPNSSWINAFQKGLEAERHTITAVRTGQ